MANNFDSNTTTLLARIFLDKFESARVLSKTVNTQLLNGAFNPSSGTTINFKRPTDYKTKRTSDGDVSAQAASPIITGKAVGTVQDYFTVDIELKSIDEAIKADQLPQLIDPMATRIVTDLETDFGQFMLNNAGVSTGDPDTAVTTWQQVANAGALLSSLGVPADMPWNYVMNPFTESELADQVRNMGAGGPAGGRIQTALDQAVLNEKFAGMRIMRASTLASFTTTAISDKAGSFSAAPDVTYATAKDTMTQVWAVTGFTASLVLKAGCILEVTGRNQINLSTRKTFVDGAGAARLFRAVVTADVLLGSSGEGNVTVAGPGIFETDGAYNTTDTALANSDVITIINDESTLFQPNLFYHQNAFAIGSVPQQKLNATDTLATTEDGLQIRVSKGSDIRANLQIVRFDLVVAYSVLNPFFAGQGHG